MTSALRNNLRVPLATLIGLAILALIFAAVIGFVATRPGEFRIERSALVDAPREAIFPLINDFRQWFRWSPYEKFDPNMKKGFDGPPSGPGAVYTWSGNSKAGEGKATILEVKPDELVAIKLEFIRPFVATNQARFTLVPVTGGTRVSWSMDGKNNLIGKAMSVFIDLDALVGKDFEEGLANLNSAAHAATP
jgi:hypothetical protein